MNFDNIFDYGSLNRTKKRAEQKAEKFVGTMPSKTKTKHWWSPYLKLEKLNLLTLVGFALWIVSACFLNFFRSSIITSSRGVVLKAESLLVEQVGSLCSRASRIFWKRNFWHYSNAFSGYIANLFHRCWLLLFSNPFSSWFFVYRLGRRWECRPSRLHLLQPGCLTDFIANQEIAQLNLNTSVIFLLSNLFDRNWPFSTWLLSFFWH